MVLDGSQEAGVGIPREGGDGGSSCIDVVAGRVTGHPVDPVQTGHPTHAILDLGHPGQRAGGIVAGKDRDRVVVCRRDMQVAPAGRDIDAPRLVETVDAVDLVGVGLDEGELSGAGIAGKTARPSEVVTMARTSEKPVASSWCSRCDTNPPAEAQPAAAISPQTAISAVFSLSRICPPRGWLCGGRSQFQRTTRIGTVPMCRLELEANVHGVCREVSRGRSGTGNLLRPWRRRPTIHLDIGLRACGHGWGSALTAPTRPRPPSPDRCRRTAGRWPACRPARPRSGRTGRRAPVRWLCSWPCTVRRQ